MLKGQFQIDFILGLNKANESIRMSLTGTDKITTFDAHFITLLIKIDPISILFFLCVENEIKKLIRQYIFN